MRLKIDIETDSGIPVYIQLGEQIRILIRNGSLKAGDLMLLDAFGGGLTWGSALIPFSPLKEKRYFTKKGN